jgi:para-aminobenzoate synthetase/4-amino-4-deoxychorismate lyase
LPQYGRRIDGPRPEPLEGVFETLLVVDGEPVELEVHLARLAASTRELYGQNPPPEARELVHDNARGLDLGRLRLDVVPAGGGLEMAVKVAQVEPALVFPSWERAVTLAPVVVPGGIGAHKWSDRRLLEQADRECAPALALVVDTDGSVHEVSRGNVFLVLDGALVTPPPDGRLLPGIARRRVGDAGAAAGIELREEVVSGEDLAAASEVLVSGSVRGVEPVRACEGLGHWDEGPVTAALAERLRALWMGSRDRV